MQVRSAMETIKAELKVNTTSLSSSIRTRICASDDRPSSATIGWVGAVLLGLVFGTLVLTDAVNVITFIVSRVSKQA
ncbi:hypothetical protein KP79_PYT20627 [Mizuhopecten yessoensis]|uniref:Uncharacterized protein n=1 Tax=Mizuhopecten yessoensis TaxID=6573 RepID=A0A210PXG9_MIZYE|nr:hypothetical protein KP79_PYT20627 [Mizuhopecten yessoensis]